MTQYKSRTARSGLRLSREPLVSWCALARSLASDRAHLGHGWVGVFRGPRRGSQTAGWRSHHIVVVLLEPRQWCAGRAGECWAALVKKSREISQKWPVRAAHVMLLPLQELLHRAFIGCAPLSAPGFARSFAQTRHRPGHGRARV